MPARLSAAMRPPSTRAMPGGVVAAVLQPPQALDHDALRLLVPDIAHDSAHGPESTVRRRPRAPRTAPAGHRARRRAPTATMQAMPSSTGRENGSGAPVRRARAGRLGGAGRLHRAAADRRRRSSRLRGLGDELDLDEVQQVYLPLSRLLSMYVESAARLHRRQEEFLRPALAPAHPVRDRAGRARSRSASRPPPGCCSRCWRTGPSTPRSRWSPPTASCSPTPSSSAAGCCSARASRSPTTARRCCGSSSTSSPARTRSRRRSTPT